MSHARSGREDLLGGTGFTAEEVEDSLRAMVLSDDYPCLGARSVFTRRTAHVELVDELADPDSTALYEALASYAATTGRDADDTAFVSFVAAFRHPVVSSEAEFEQLLWRQLAQLHALDTGEAQAWDPAVSADPSNPHFAFSIAGVAFFVVGMHPRASRIARRTPWPVLVFNLHRQFEALRASGRYERMRDTIRRRDVRLQGSVNPMVADHGSLSEARQYSGRAVRLGWEPPVGLTEDQTPLTENEDR
ncbi:MAG TPA: guanitoxin biosynthesis heme-dependent pre-guanitoxin N-hydroxylase GntA [Propionibacteriaceae bacterium]|nr:guanitoxin biosynthesis heme-dependent pre-guanitoxin N-hydroxylase GntA [Propionibacteriaceae bacterium]